MHGRICAVIALHVLCGAGCISTGVDVCANGLTCPPGQVCSDTHGKCVFPEQIEDCLFAEEASACQFPGSEDAACYDGLCTERGCGNGVLEITLDPPEVCDDGNTDRGDGCSADCYSDETCANGVIDPDELCDDGNSLSGDGCSSACALEKFRFQKFNQDPPGQLSDASMAFDERRGVVVLQGGQLEDSSKEDRTYEWTGSAWRSIEVSPNPGARNDNAMVYDRAREVCLLYSYDGATWEWDGALWTLASPSQSPPARSNAALAYDAVRERVVLFGGYVDTSFFADTWEWDGTTWSPAPAGTSPEPRAWHGMAYDPRRGVTVLFGGRTAIGDTGLADTWEFDGTAWTDVTPESSPLPRWGHSMVFDPVLGEVLMFGGGDTTETWSWDGERWLEHTAGSAPGAAQGTAMAADSVRGNVVLFGGTGLIGVSSETWLWNGSEWHATPTSTGPPAATGVAAAADPKNGRIIFYGGKDANVLRGDTWQWLGSGWGPVGTANEPDPARWSHAMAMDTGNDVIVLFGGIGPVSATDFLSDTWIFDGTDWSKPTIAGDSPGARARHAMAYDPVRDRVVLFGGDAGAAALDDTWEWNGSSWVDMDPATAPPPMREHSMYWDRASERIVLIGYDQAVQNGKLEVWSWNGVEWLDETPAVSVFGFGRFGLARFPPLGRALFAFGADRTTKFNSLLTWDGTGFEIEAPVGVPLPRADVAAGYDSIGRQVVFFGGLDSSNVTLGETWLLSLASGEAEQSCLEPADRDGDGLIGCDDQDCWGYCRPLCGPEALCTESPHCGDGTCDALENCTLCPADCLEGCDPVCGNVVCEDGESVASCPGDCSHHCGNGVCESAETEDDCPEDC